MGISLGCREDGSAERCDGGDLVRLANARMPFGKHAGRLLSDLPETYIIWFLRNDVSAGKLATMMRAIYEIKVNGLEYLLKPLRDDNTR